MTTDVRKKGLGARVMAVLVAVATALGIATVAVPQASADTRAVLRPGCTWDDYQFYVQNCMVPSPSMGQDIKVQIQAASAGGDAGVYLLDGLRAPETHSAWTWDGNAPRTFVNDNVTLAMPVGGAAQFYSDWKGPFGGNSNPKNPKWETFLTSELPGYLQSNFGVNPQKNSAVGLSMGALAALNLAGMHRDQFKQVTSLSGYTNPTFPGMNVALQASMTDAAGPGALYSAMWGLPGDPNRYRHDPLLNVGNFSGMPVFLSAMNGVPTVKDLSAGAINMITGSTLEMSSFSQTVRFELAARAAGAQVTSSYPVLGLHNWNTWDAELVKARGHILASLGA